MRGILSFFVLDQALEMVVEWLFLQLLLWLQLQQRLRAAGWLGGNA